MSDIFEIKGIDAKIKIGDAEYKFCDPRFKDKVMIQKKLKDLRAREESMDPTDYALESNEISKEMIRQYLPDIPLEVLDQMGDALATRLLSHLLELSSSKFSSVVGKAEASV